MKIYLKALKNPFQVLPPAYSMIHIIHHNIQVSAANCSRQDAQVTTTQPVRLLGKNRQQYAFL